MQLNEGDQAGVPKQVNTVTGSRRKISHVVKNTQIGHNRKPLIASVTKNGVWKITIVCQNKGCRRAMAVITSSRKNNSSVFQEQWAKRLFFFTNTANGINCIDEMF